MHAFEQVTKLRPDYADGQINIGLTDIEWEKYSSARAPLERALELSPNNPRVAVLSRCWWRDVRVSFDEEVADSPAGGNPISAGSQTRSSRGVGIAYYQRYSYQEAMEQFEALQKIDPDDLAAHYNLAVIYRRMGMKEKAAAQAALFATKQVDPGAPTYSLEFLRKHREISTESVPWHVHSDISPTVRSGGRQ